MTYQPSQRVTISCGTVCLDFEQSPTKVIIIYNKKLDIYQLPKGRKNIGEGLEDAAMRETWEETGVTPRPLPLKVATRSTLPSKMKDTPEISSTEDSDSSADEGPIDPGLTTTLPNNEFIATVHYLDLQAATPDTEKTVFFFAAAADSTQPFGSHGQEDHEKLRAEWVDIDTALDLLRFEAEKNVVRKAVQDASRTGYRA